MTKLKKPKLQICYFYKLLAFLLQTQRVTIEDARMDPESQVANPCFRPICFEIVFAARSVGMHVVDV